MCRRTALLLALLGLLSLGFEWEGRLTRLTRDFETSDAARRRDIVRLFAGYPASDVRGPLLRALEDDDATVRIEAADVAGRVRLRDAAVLIVEWLDDPDVALREAAAVALGRLDDTPHLGQLVRALGDADARVRRAAVGALGAIGGREAVVPLLGRLDDDDPQVRVDAASALAALHDDRAAVSLVGRARDPVPEVRAAVYMALGELGDARGLAPLVQGLRDDNDDARIAAIGALGRLGQDAAVEPLTDRLETDDSRGKRTITAALGALVGPSPAGRRALETLVSALSDPDTSMTATDVLAMRADARPTSVGARDASDDSAPAQVTEPGWSARSTIVEALAAGLDRGLSPTPIARALVRLAASGPIDAAAPALERAVDARVGGDANLLRALALTGAEPMLVRLLEELRGTDTTHQAWALDALSAYFDRVAPDGRAADPLLAALGRVPPELRDEVVALLGRVRARRALPALRPLLASPDVSLRLATVRAVGQIGDRDGADILDHLLDDRDARVRFEAADALGRTGDAMTMAALTARLESRAPVDRHAVVIALGGVLSALRRAGGPASGRTLAVQALLRAARSDDLALAARAIDALAVAADPQSVPAIVALAESAAPSSRAAALRALGAFDDARAHAALVTAARGHEGDLALAALGAIGEHGTADDAALLLDAAANARWPRSVGAAFSLARLARRGLLAGSPDVSTKLCVLFASRDVYVRANVAIALASLGAGACAEPPVSPLELLLPRHGEVVRLAAVRWAAAAAAAGNLPAADSTRALARCVSRDPSPDVSRACASPELPALGDVADVVAYDPTGRTLRPNSLLALRLADGSVLVARSDANAHLRVANAAHGGLSLDNPLDTPLDPQ